MTANYFLDRTWFAQTRRMRRSDPIYKPALLLVVLDLLSEGVVPYQIPLAQASRRFDELLERAGLLESRGRGRAFMPAYHLSSSSRTAEPFWMLLHAGLPIGPMPEPSSTPALLLKAQALAIVPDLALDILDSTAIEIATAGVHRLLEEDGRPDCLALLRAHDEDLDAVESLVTTLQHRETQYPFVLDDAEAKTMLTFREQVVRDRSLRRVVLPAYDFACALCASRIFWNHLHEVEAAHIKPRSQLGCDDPRNTLALCRTHHWAFDLGLWSTDEHRRVVVAPAMESEDGLEALRPWEGQALRDPTPTTARPHADALLWHREHVFRTAA